jgi:heavy metal-binding protein
MRIVRLCAVSVIIGVAWACTERATPTPDVEPARTQGATSPNPSTDLAYVCPMDRDIRSNDPGKCPRCGMELVAGIPDPTEYHMDLTVTPKPAVPNERVRLTFEVFDPWTDHRVETFTVVHEKLFHAFIVSRDLQFFVHDHPTWDGRSFHYDITFPKAGMYRVLGDFYPEAAAPQLITDTIFVAGSEAPAASLVRDYSTKTAENLNVAFSSSPPEPIAGVTTQMRFDIAPGEGLQKYLGAWAHMLVASEDLIDMMHTHPFLADGSPTMQFSLVFPRPSVYRVWVQFQRNRIVNTAHFDVRVKASESVPTN